MGKDSKKGAAYVSGMRGAERPASKGEEAPKLASGADRVSVRRAENGFIASCSYPPKKGKEYNWQPDVDHVFATAADVAEFIEQTLGVKDKEK